MSEYTPVAIIVEDEPQIRRFVRLALEEEGWQVHEADTLRRGLIDAGMRKPNLIVLDVWGPSHSESSHYLHVYMRHLRQKLEDDPAQPCYLLTETAIGYRLVLPS
jgi:DNA-binding response OmpR family regulator